jgi:hypothetical protein
MWKFGTEAAQFPEKEYTKWDFRCSVVPVLSAFYFVLQGPGSSLLTPCSWNLTSHSLVLGSWLLTLDSYHLLVPGFWLLPHPRGPVYWLLTPLT